MYVCMHVCICVYVCVHIYACVCVCMYVYVCVCIHACVHECIMYMYYVLVLLFRVLCLVQLQTTAYLVIITTESPSAVGNLALTVIGGTNLTFTWTAPPDADSNTRYCVELLYSFRRTFLHCEVNDTEFILHVPSFRRACDDFAFNVYPSNTTGNDTAVTLTLSQELTRVFYISYHTT